MADSSYGNAMTEIALALAMAFFSIMVLTMVSMSAAPSDPAKRDVPRNMKLVESKPGKGSDAHPGQKPQLVIFWKGQLLDSNLAPVSPQGFAPKTRVILAMPPELPMAEALAVRARFAGRNTVVSALDARWLARLRIFDANPNSKGN